jgi:hypothetical protein
MTQLQPSITDEQPVAEPTLGELLTRAVRTTVPTRLYQLLHLAFPLAVDFAFRGWWRPAAWALAVTAFGAWGLADRWLWTVAGDEYERPSRWRVRVVTGARLVAGATAATLSALLILELFLRLLGAAPIS